MCKEKIPMRDWKVSFDFIWPRVIARLFEQPFRPEKERKPAADTPTGWDRNGLDCVKTEESTPFGPQRIC